VFEYPINSFASGHYIFSIADITARAQRFLSKTGTSSLPHGYWTQDEGIKMREFFDNLAKSRNLDALNPNDWYSLRNMNIAEAGVRIFQ
jgi:hypothetical protein